MTRCTGGFPKRRDGVIHRADAWNGQTGLRGQAWGIPQERITGFKNQPGDAKTRRTEVQSVSRKRRELRFSVGD